MKNKRPRKPPVEKVRHTKDLPKAEGGASTPDPSAQEITDGAHFIDQATIVDVVRLPANYGGTVLQWRFLFDGDPGLLGMALSGFKPIKNSPLGRLLVGLGIEITPDLWFKPEMVIGRRCIVSAAFNAESYLNVKAIIAPLNIEKHFGDISMDETNGPPT